MDKLNSKSRKITYIKRRKGSLVQLFRYPFVVLYVVVSIIVSIIVIIQKYISEEICNKQYNASRHHGVCR